MDRRTFVAALGGIAARVTHGDREILLEAVVAAQMPRLLAVRGFPEGTFTPSRIFELRVYSSSVPLEGIFHHAGIHPLFSSSRQFKMTYLIPFEDLTAREKAWATLNADDEWAKVRQIARVIQMSIFRLQLHRDL